MPYNGDTELIPDLMQGLPEGAFNMIMQWLYDSQQWQTAIDFDAIQVSTVLLHIGLGIRAILQWQFECLHELDQFQFLTSTPDSAVTKYRLHEQAWGLSAPCLVVSLVSVDTTESTPSSALSRGSMNSHGERAAQSSLD